MDKAPVKMLAGFSSIAGMVLLLVVTFNVTQQPQPVVSQADESVNVIMLTNNEGFNDENTILIDFSKESCCKTLSHEYMEDGVVFDNEETLGWGTYQANGFVNHVSVEEAEPGAPTGMSGTRISFSEPVSKSGFMVQSGTPFNPEAFRSAKSLTVKVYDENNNLLFYKVTDTCLAEISSCRPRLIGVESDSKSIKYLEVIINETSSWSMDDLVFEI